MSKREPVPDFYSEPQIRHLAQVLKEIDGGQLLIPKFQRPLVWPKSMRLDLFDSVLRGIPIGTIMEWRTHSVKVAVKDRLAPFLLAEPARGAPIRRYLLDGEQRLTTLYFALFEARSIKEDVPVTGSEEGDDDKDAEREVVDDFLVYYDLRGKKFVVKSELSKVLSHHLPLTELLQGARLTKFQRKLENQSLSEQDPLQEGQDKSLDVEALTELSDEVADAFRQYKVPTVPVTSDDLKLVTRTFQRVNSQHRTMEEVHMIAALTWADDFDLLDRFDSMRSELFEEIGWDAIEDQTILRVLKLALGLPAYEDDAEKVGGAIAGAHDKISSVSACIASVAEFFRESCHIKTPQLVPYAAQIVVLAAAFLEVPSPSGEVRERLRDWLWFTTYTEAFQRQMNDSRFSQVIQEVRAMARGESPKLFSGKPPSRRRLTRFDFRHARARALSVMLADLAPHDPSPDAPGTNAVDLLSDRLVRAVPQLLAAVSSPGARVVLRVEAIGAMRKMLQSLDNDAPEDFLKSHLISSAAYVSYREGDYAKFVKLREDDIDRMEEKKFAEIIAQLYPNKKTKGPMHA